MTVLSMNSNELEKALFLKCISGEHYVREIFTFAFVVVNQGDSFVFDCVQTNQVYNMLNIRMGRKRN